MMMSQSSSLLLRLLLLYPLGICPQETALPPSNTTESDSPMNSCFVASSLPGCNDEDCLAAICASEPACCEGAYNQTCIQVARDNDQVCEAPSPSPPTNTCVETSPFGGCNNAECSELVCDVRADCCNEGSVVGEWSPACIQIAQDVCAGKGLNSCFEKVRSPGCNDPDCAAVVCKLDDYCCDKQWENSCVQKAFENLDSCPNGHAPQDNTCFEVEIFGRSGCDDPACQDIVCQTRPECCNGPYNGKCTEIALEDCELPVPQNHCFEVSGVPGCNDEDCLEAVCDEMEECCTAKYSNKCIDIARDNGLVCRPPKQNNDCFDDADFGGCEDLRCARAVCDFRESCCDTDEKIGEWSDTCVSIAEDVCQPEILPRPDEGICPHGFTCDEGVMANCTELRNVAVDVFELGDIYGGIYCGGEDDDDGVKNCKQGWYCPTPEQMFKCPAGKYCPYKTAKPEIECSMCEEGAEQLERDLFGYIVLCILGGLVLLYFCYKLVLRYNRDLVDRIHDFEKSVFLSHFQELEHRIVDLKHMADDALKSFSKSNQQEELDKMRPKLELIYNRLKEVESVDSSRSSSMSGFGEKQASSSDFKPLEFDARRVFDVLDADASGDVTYEELNVILGLNELELAEFVRRMNELAGDKNPCLVSITRPVFVKYFLQVLNDTSNLTVTFGEAEALFTEMAGPGKNNMHMSKFYDSTMSNFLSDVQILKLIKRFKAIKQGSNPGQSGTGLMSTRQARRPSTASLSSVAGGNYRTLMMVSKADFTEHYPALLLEITVDTGVLDEEEGKAEKPGVDITFQNLCLNIKVGDTSISVVNNVTGRVQGKTMTALMGGSGAGKTSLMNALCGRSFYGEVTGTVDVNGQRTSIEEIKDSVGFVPQDDIVYAELTVRENLIFAGRFRLPTGTPEHEIEDLADSTLANLGLSRVANSPVGDVTRRGVSGGEKKRVNIGLELMCRPQALFLDEPTSGLDSSSALLVMKSLAHLVKKEGVTIVSVIHQPRKFIYDLFDSLILLGVGGKMVYHGPTENATSYFNSLHYTLPEGESVADWLIDISSGRLEKDNKIASCHKSEKLQLYNLRKEASRHLSNLEEIVEDDEPPVAGMTKPEKATPQSDPDLDIPPPFGGVVHESQVIHVTDNDVCGAKGVTTGKVVAAFEEAKSRRAWLYEEWEKHFGKLSGADKAIYEVPEEYALPDKVCKPSFWYQLDHQIRRASIVAWRNRFSKVIDLTIVVGAVIVISILSGVNEVAFDLDPQIPFKVMTRPNQDDNETIFKELFAYAFTKQLQYPLKVGIITCVLIGLTATKIVTSKRIEFFREAGSGYNLNAYFVAITCFSTVEHSVQALIAAFFAFWIRNPLASAPSFIVHFVLLAWVTAGWGLLIPMVTPPDSIVLVAGFFFAFCGLMFSGANSPVLYTDIYEGSFLEVFSGWIAPTRFFFEALTVGEYRCLPEQSGFTIEDEALNRPSNTSAFFLLGYAGNDPTATERSCSGWYWSVLPAVLVGITVRFAAMGCMHSFSRAQQTKKPLLYTMRRDKSLVVAVVVYSVVFAALFCVTTWLMIRDVPYVEREPSKDDLISRYIGF